MAKSNLPVTFDSGDDFYDYVHDTFEDPYCEHQGGGAWVAYSNGTLVGTYDEDSKVASWETE